MREPEPWAWVGVVILVLEILTVLVIANLVGFGIMR